MRESLIFLLGFTLAGFIYYVVVRAKESPDSSKEVKSYSKPTIDYQLQTNGKLIDTIWIYKFKQN